MESIYQRNLKRAGAYNTFLPALPSGYLWRPSPSLISVAAGATVRLTGLADDKVVPVACVLLFADQLNATTLSIGPSNMTVAAGAAPNIASFQLDAGRSTAIYTDDVLTEFFDLGTYFAAHNDAALTMALYVTVFTAVPI